jgi:hypothetical protein
MHYFDVHDESNDCTTVSFTRDWCVTKTIKRGPCRAENGRGPVCASPGIENEQGVECSELKISQSISPSRVAFLRAAIFCRNRSPCFVARRVPINLVEI